MPVDSPEEIERQRGDEGKNGTTFFYWIFFIVMIIGMLAIYANYHDGVSPTQGTVNPTPVQPEQP